jgi:hypothetical protein
MSRDLKAEVFDILPKFESESDLRRLYCELLNYEYANVPVSTRDWATLAREVTEYGLVIAKRGSFYVVFLRIKKLTVTNERSVLNEVLKTYPDCVVIFYGSEEGLWHIVSPRFDPERLHKFLLRRYVIGPHERLRTAAERLTLTYSLDEDSTARIKEKHDNAFNVEAVTNEFFEKYKEVLGAVKNDLLKQKKADEQTVHAFTQQLLNRLMFLYFVQKKEWLNKDSSFIRNLWVKYERLHSVNDSFYEALIEPLFFYSFNKKLIPSNYDLPKEFVEIYGKMPFLNGGLFAHNELDDVGLKVKDSQMRLIIDGLLERFNFTIREDLPFDVEVAVDPEMLGKVYETLVLEEERGKSGIFYTPRIEVDFMCRQAIIEYLVETTGIPYDTVISFVWTEPTAETPKVEREELRIIRDALWNVKIVDPACGSGAFLVGIMHVLFDFHKRIAAELGEVIGEFEIKRRILQENLFGVDIKPWAIRVAELRLWLTLIVDVDESEMDLFSEPLLPNLTFKLHVGDSLVQELASKQISVRAIYNRLPLSVRGDLKKLIQLKRDYYYGKGNADISEKVKEKEIKILSDIIKARLKEIDIKLKTVAGVQQRFATAIAISKEEERRNQEKETLDAEKEELEKTLNALKEVRTLFFWEIDFPEVFANGGFDIVIGNPPYVRQELIAPANLPLKKQTNEVRRKYKEKVADSVEVHWGPEFQRDMKSDFYIYFFYHGFSLLKPGGTFCFITSNSWLGVEFGFNFQRFLLRNMETKAVYDNQAKRTFAESDINTVISVFKRPTKPDSIASNIYRFVSFKKPFEQVLNERNLTNLQHCSELCSTQSYRCFAITQKQLWELGLSEESLKQISLDRNQFAGDYVGDKWGAKFLRSPDIYFTIMKKAEGKLTSLRRVAELSYGLKTGINEFFLLDNSKLKEWGIEREFLKPILVSTKAIRGYVVDRNWADMFLFSCGKEIEELRSTNAFKYIRWGEKQKTRERGGYKKGGIPFPKVASVLGRKLWYDVGSKESGDFIINQFIDKRFFFAVNEPGILVSNIVFEGTWNCGTDKELQNALINSTLTFLFVEILGRVNLGEGLLTMYGPDIGLIPILKTATISPKCRKEILDSFQTMKNRNVESIFQEVDKADRRKLDNLVFDMVGLNEKEREEVYTSLLSMVTARLEKATSLGKM